MDGWVDRLISLCVNLESLVIEDSFGIDNLKICSTKLKELSICNFKYDLEPVDSAEIRAPNLCSLRIVCLRMVKFSLEFSSSLIEANVTYSSRRKQFKYWSRVMRSLTGVKRLTTHNWWFELVQTKDLLSEGFSFNNLVYLEIETGYAKNDLIGLAAFLELSPKIETLVVDHDDYIEDDGSIPEDLLSSGIAFSLPSIKLVGMKGFRGMDNEIFFWLLLKRSGVVSEDFRDSSDDT